MEFKATAISNASSVEIGTVSTQSKMVFFKHNKNRIIQLTGELKSSQGNGDRIKE